MSRRRLGGEALEDRRMLAGWPVQVGGITLEDQPAVAAFTDGSAIVAGNFQGTSGFGGTTLTSSGDSDLFFAKLDRNGDFAWAARGGQSTYVTVAAVATHADGAAIATGTFFDSATFGSTTLTSAGENDVFVAKLNADGTFAWATQVGGGSIDSVSAIATLADGSAVVTGSYSDSVTFGSTTLTSVGVFNVFVAKLNANGTWAWATSAGGGVVDVGNGIAPCSDGSLVVTGNFSGTATFGGTTLTGTGSDDIFVAKLDAAGTFAWAAKAGGTQQDVGTAVATLADGSAVVTGYYQGSAAFGSTTLTSSGDFDVFVAKLDANGSFVWAATAGGSNNDMAYGIGTRADGSAVVTGYFESTAAFGGTSLNSVSNQVSDVFIAGVNADGTFAWATRAGGGDLDRGDGVAMLADGSAVVTGQFQGPASFGSTTLAGGAGPSAFVAKVSPTGTIVALPGIPTITSATAGNAQVTLAWTPPVSDGGAAVSDYVVEFKTAAGATWSTYDDGVSSAASAVVKNLQPGTAYVFRVSATTLAGTGAASVASGPATPFTVPGAPTITSATAGNGQATLTWTVPASNGGSAITDYAIRYSTDGGATWAKFDRTSSTATTAALTGLANGTTYLFRVRGVNAAGVGNLSNAVTVKPITVPSAPSITAATAGNGQATLTWTVPPSNGGATITDYAIRYSTDGGATWAKFDRAQSTSNTAVLTGLVNGTTYLFRVRGVNAAGVGALSNAVTVKPITVPSAPTITSATASNGEATLTWTTPTSDGGSAITDYAIRYSTDGGTTWAKFDRATSIATTVTLTGLTKGATYLFRVRGVNAAGPGTPSNTVTVKP